MSGQGHTAEVVRAPQEVLSGWRLEGRGAGKEGGRWRLRVSAATVSD